MGSISFVLCVVMQAQAAELTPIYKVSRVDPKKWETVYVFSEDKAEELAVSENFRNAGLLGYAAKEPGQGRTALYEAYHDGWHIYYTELPDEVKLRAGTKIKSLKVYVWEKSGEGRIPIYGVSEPSWRNVRYYNIREDVKNTIERAKKALGKDLKYLGIVFYLETKQTEE